MNYLVIGCNGMAGHMISLYLKEQGHNVVGYARRKSYFVDTVVGDVRDVDIIKNTILKGNFDTVINCVGLLNQFADSNQADAIWINGYFPHLLAQITKDTDIQIIQMSTDCVFSGKTGNYVEESVPDGISIYDRTKAIGELIDEKNVTFRNSIVGPDTNKDGIGLLNWFMQQNKSVKGFTNAIWTGQTTLQLAITMEEASKKRIHGLYNMVPDGVISKFDLLNLFNQHIRKEPIEVIPYDDFILDKSLIRTNFKGFDYIIPDYETMVKDLADWMNSHKELYPHYYK